VSEEHEDRPVQPESSTSRNEFDGSASGPVLQTGSVGGNVYFHGRRRRVPRRWRWLWIGAGLSVVVFVAYLVLLSVWPTPRDPSPTDDEVIHVNDLSDRSTADADDHAWATAAVIEPAQVSGSVNDVPHLMEATEGVRVGQTEIGVVLEAATAEPVLVQEITARVVDTSDALSGTLVAPPDLGGPVPRYILGFDLDESTPAARNPDGHGGLGERFSEHANFMVVPGEKYVFSLHGLVKTPHTYRWVVDLQLLVGDQRQTMTIGDDDPFIATGPAPVYERYYRKVARSDVLTPVDARELCPTGNCLANAETWAQVF
jgi:hypothetical protein